MVKKITFHIDASGNVTLDVSGVTGNRCDELSEPFESILGALSKKERKDSYYANTTHNDELIVDSTEVSNGKTEY